MRILVYIHGACLHQPGFSDSWFTSMAPYTSVYGSGKLGVTRFEVVWSNLINHAPVNPLQLCIADFFQYLDDLTVRQTIINAFTSVVQPLLDYGNQLDIIAHSEGTIVSYEGLRALSPVKSRAAIVSNYFTVGAALGFQYGPLGTDNVRNRLLPQNQDGAKPGIVDSWWNLEAIGDPFGSQLSPAYSTTQDFINLPAVGCPDLDNASSSAMFPHLLCAHESYWNPANVAVNRDIFAAKINSPE